MARLPQASDLRTIGAPSETPGVRVAALDYSPMAKAGDAMASGLREVGKGLELAVKAGNETDDYETKKKLLDFKLASEMALEEHKRAMPAGGAGYAETWSQRYRDMASEFVGDKDGNIPAQQRGHVGLMLKQHETTLSERAQRDEWAERDRAEIDGLETTLGRTRSFVEADPKRRDEMLAEGRGLIDASRITPAARDRLHKHFSKELDKTAVVSRIMAARTAEDFQALEKELAPNAPDRRQPISMTPDGGMTVVGTGSGAKFRVAAPHAERFAGLLRDLEAEGVAIKDDQSGGYANRNIAGTNTRSKHADGAAVDLNWHDNARGTLGEIRKQVGADKLREIAARNGLKWGGDFSTPDDMHFEVDQKRPVARRGLTQVAGLSAGPSDDPAAYAGPYGSLTITERRAYWGQIETQRKKLVGEVEKVIKEQTGTALAGYLPPEPMMKEIESRVRTLGDPMLAAQYQVMLNKADMTQKLQHRTPVEAAEIARQLRASLGNSATKEQLDIVEHAEKVAESIRTNVAKDPMTWVHNTRTPVPVIGSGTQDTAAFTADSANVAAVGRQPIRLEALDFNAPDIDARLSHRAEQSRGVAAMYGGNISPFTESDVSLLSQTLRKGGAPMLTILGRIYRAFGDDTPEAMNGFAKQAPEAFMLAKGMADGLSPELLQDVSKGMHYRIAEGDKFKPTVDRAFVDLDTKRLNPLLARTPGLVDPIREFVSRAYEFRHRANGRIDFDKTLWDSTVQEALGQRQNKEGVKFGGVATQGSWGWKTNAETVVPPTVRNDSFDAMIELVRGKDVEKMGSPRFALPGSLGRVLTAEEVRAATWEYAGKPGQYALYLGDANGRRTYAVDTKGQPAVINVNPLIEDWRKEKPEIFWK